MRAAVLSPAERQEVTPGIIADLEEHFSDTPTCVSCDAAATVFAMPTCCRVGVLECGDHYREDRARVRAQLLTMGAQCRACGIIRRAPLTVDDVLKAVTL